jgi:hypothetical protein
MTNNQIQPQDIAIRIARQAIELTNTMSRWHHADEIDAVRSRAMRLIHDAMERQAVVLRDSYRAATPEDVS